MESDNYMNDGFSAVFARRTAISFFVIILLFLGSILRVAVVSTKGYTEAQASQSSKRITVGRTRGTVFDCNMIPITNSSSKLVAAVSPTPRAAVAISSILSGEERERVLDTLSKGAPAVCEVPYDPECDGITVTRVYNHTAADMPAVHTVGYTDGAGHGVSGIEAAFDDILYSDKTVDAIFTTDGKGGILTGLDPYFENAASMEGGGVVTTLNINIQTITEQACAGIEKGAAVVCEIASGKLRAAVSLPTFDITAVSESLESADSPMLNRTVSAFSVGSVFKPCAAAAAIECGVSYNSCNCTGNIKIGNRVFNCHNRTGHGEVDLKGALALSCNSFFYNLASHTGGEALYSMASSLGFGSSVILGPSLKTAEGNLPKRSELTTDADLANLGIGQGSLLLSPISVLTLYCAIGSDGCYITPSLIEGTLKNGKLTLYNAGSPTRAMREKTAKLLREHLAEVILTGTGTAAAPKNCTAAGKTATAQTGRFIDGAELTNSWFCGFFPADNPKYAIAVMSEGVPTKSTAAVFADIADGICELEGIKQQPSE